MQSKYLIEPIEKNVQESNSHYHALASDMTEINLMDDSADDIKVDSYAIDTQLIRDIFNESFQQLFEVLKSQKIMAESLPVPDDITS